MATGERKCTIKNADMCETMQQEATELAVEAMDRYSTERDIANYIRKEFDKRHSPFWHVIVGKNFGSYVTHETKHFIYFNCGQLAFLMFKAVERLGGAVASANLRGGLRTPLRCGGTRRG
eukprot:CAMPEP_0176053574 /NCGR_PEP_ID=MMETSP0120_2-20121206/26648_1 /TAXON_ID=160619 /ORGANISM="Kryptoperidinium foliaceum, Strain CCMP 1326" /LENGTH=119 /DNA_ID=CAMNT_0017387029 /DNA_START=53 /DNA_END=410 /DNA_ORIENTATION=+